MASVTVEPGPGGIPRIRRMDRPLDPSDRFLAIATAMLAMAGLVVATLMPAPMLLVTATCCAAAELAVRFQPAESMPRAPAQVVPLRPGRAAPAGR
ncbi:MAG TPA: hypothetical protein VLS93_12680 [Anaeromyxobacteraceae bacterium]|nr:hypothetical protein [Anaeromyxobacteraceae bacterium]